VADVHDGRLLTDDGDARSFAKDQGVTVIGSVGVLLAAIDAGKIDEATADEWLSTWIDEIGYYVPYQSISGYSGCAFPRFSTIRYLRVRDCVGVSEAARSP